MYDGKGSGGPQVNCGTGGTSNASPRLAGMVACYMQENPDANLKDVRKWIQANSFSIPTCNDSSRKRWLLGNFILMGEIGVVTLK